MISESLQQALAEVEKLPDAEQDLLAGLMQAYLIRKRGRTRALSYNTKLWARLREEDPEYVRDHDEAQREHAKTAEHFIGLVLLVDWDPIGVFGIPAMETEYVRYIPGVHILLLTYPTVEAVAEHIFTIEREQMGLGRKNSVRQAVRRAEIMEVAQKLVSLSSEWKLEAAAEGSSD